MGVTPNGGGSGGGSFIQPPPPPPPPQQQQQRGSCSLIPSTCDSETEFSVLFNQLLSSSSSSSPIDPTIILSGSGYHPPNNRVPISSSSSSTFHFSDDEDAYIPLHSHPNNTISSPIQKDGEVSELPSKPAPQARTSSKRSRAAEFHNLSEKRRRSRINEKMKALQNLIPNSNKTDKASMLDEAIEYLKQLQLQVQMLMMRNGLSLHPMSLPGGLRPMILPQTGLSFDEGSGFQNSLGRIASSANDEGLVAQPSFSFPKQCSISNQSVALPSVTNVATSDTSSCFQPSIKDAHCSSSSSMPQLLLDTSRIGKSPSPDVS